MKKYIFKIVNHLFVKDAIIIIISIVFEQSCIQTIQVIFVGMTSSME